MDMDELLQWTELIAYLTASLAAFIYICDTSFIYISGIKKQLQIKNKENTITSGIDINSKEQTPASSLIIERYTQHPQYRRKFVVDRRYVQSPVYMNNPIYKGTPESEFKTIEQISGSYDASDDASETSKEATEIAIKRILSSSDESDI